MKHLFNKIFLSFKHAIERLLLARRLKKFFAGKDYCFISSNCLGGRFSQMLGKQYRSPTVGLYFDPTDFLSFLSDLPRNLETEMTCDENHSIQMGYPIGVINNCKIHLMHYKNFSAAKDKWNQRRARVNLRDAFYIFTDREGATYEQLQAFDRLPFEHKMAFVHKPYPELRSAVYVKGFEREGQVGELYSLSHYLNSALTPQKLKECSMKNAEFG